MIISSQDRVYLILNGPMYRVVSCYLVLKESGL